MLPLLLASAFADNFDYCHGGARTNESIHVPKVPTGYSLKMVFVITRHGARTPLKALPKLEPTWNCTENELAVLSTSNKDTEDVHLLFRKVPIPGLQLLAGNCFAGQLTAYGAQQHASIGLGFRQAFIESYPLLSEHLTPHEIYLRATDVPRVQQSAQSQLLHLYPDTLNRLRAGQAIPAVPMHISEYPKDSMIPTAKTCSYITKITNDMYNASEWHSAVNGISDVISALESTYGVKINTHASDLEDFADSFHVMDCHGMSFPSAITYALRQKLYTAINHLWHLRYTDPLLNSLSLGGFMAEMVGVYSKTGKAGEPLFRLYSGHDTTLAPLMGLFGIMDGYWPPLASQLLFQTLEDSSKASFIRVIYNGVVVKLPGCSAELCPLQTFQALLNTIHTQHSQNVAKYC